MKTRLLRSLATHFAGLAAGGALAWVLVADPQDEENLPPPKHRSTTLAARFSPTVKLELERLLEDIEAEQREADAERQLTIRERNLRRIEEQRLAHRHHEKELARLRSIAGTFAETEDLSPVLTDALATGDHDLSRALFLEWHRRDPDAAFDALAERGAWQASFDPVLALAVPNEQFIAQLHRDDNSESFRFWLAERLGKKIAETDDLPALCQALESGGPTSRHLFYTFTPAWIPDNGAETARFIGLEMKPEHQRIFLEAMAGLHAQLSPQPWTEEFATALFEYDLNVSQKAFDRLAKNAKDSGSATLDTRPEGQPGPLEDGMDADEATSVLFDLLDDALHRQCDYPDLFATNRITMDEIVDSMSKEIPNASQHPGSLKRALFQKLALHNPARAITWATSALPGSQLNDDIESVFVRTTNFDGYGDLSSSGRNIWTNSYEPRTRKLAEWAAILRPAYLVHDESDMVNRWMHSRFSNWNTLAPETGKNTFYRNPSAQPTGTLSNDDPANP